MGKVMVIDLAICNGCFPDGTYTMLVAKDGFLPVKLGPIDATVKDQNLGDIALWKA